MLGMPYLFLDSPLVYKSSVCGRPPPTTDSPLPQMLGRLLSQSQDYKHFERAGRLVLGRPRRPAPPQGILHRPSQKRLSKGKANVHIGSFSQNSQYLGPFILMVKKSASASMLTNTCNSAGRRSNIRFPESTCDTCLRSPTLEVH